MFNEDTQAALTAFRNKLINADFKINQRMYAGIGTAVPNQYTRDRWRIPTAGQSAAFTLLDGENTATPPASGLEQVVEGASLTTGNHVLNWIGTASATANGAAVTKGVPFAVTAGVDLTIKFSGGTVKHPQLEAGNIATAFEHRPYGIELALCQRYYQKSFPMATAPATGAGTTGAAHFRQQGGAASPAMCNVSFNQRMRVAPTMVLYNPVTASAEIRNVDQNEDCTGSGFLIGETGFSANCTSSAGSSATQANAFHWAASAEFV